MEFFRNIFDACAHGAGYATTLNSVLLLGSYYLYNMTTWGWVLWMNGILASMWPVVVMVTMGFMIAASVLWAVGKISEWFGSSTDK